jgi:hypothetical protein
MFRRGKGCENMYGYPCCMFYLVFPVYQSNPYLQYRLIPYYDDRGIPHFYRYEPLQTGPFKREDEHKACEQSYEISYEEILASYLNIYEKRRHRITLLVRYPNTIEKDLKPYLKSCANKAAKSANKVIEVSMWKDPAIAPAAWKR